MPLNVPRLPSDLQIVEVDRKPSPRFQIYWQQVIARIETIINQIESIVGDIVDILVAIGVAQETADNGLELAQSAINPGGTIKDDKVLTDSMVTNAATVISHLFYDNGGGTLGSSGSWIDVPGGPAVVSIATGTKDAQQCFVKGLIGLRRGGGGNDFITLRCRRNDATLMAQTYTQEITNDQAILPFSFTDPDPAVSVTHTYTLQINSDDSATQVREVYVEGFLGTTG